jgi:hypothetical protein
MGLKSGPATQGKKTHESKPSSKLSSQKYVVKPESRVGAAPFNQSVSQAEKIVSRLVK